MTYIGLAVSKQNSLKLIENINPKSTQATIKINCISSAD